MDKQGWVKCDDLIEAATKAGYELTLYKITEIVTMDSKGRYTLDKKTSKIRATQGHSLDVDVGLQKKIPPVELFHGTSMEVIEGIKKHGIQKMTRQYVHLSEEIETAFVVGRRHGHPVIITIDCKAMVAGGINFYQSENKVWLVDFIDPKYFKEFIEFTLMALL